MLTQTLTYYRKQLSKKGGAEMRTYRWFFKFTKKKKKKKKREKKKKKEGKIYNEE
jgi:hypothetical protein